MPLTVLIVEDEPRNRKLASDLCHVLGHTVLQAENGQEGVHMAAANLPDLIFMDVQMPVMNGLEAIAALRGDEATRSIPVVVLTAHTMAGDEEEIRASGCDDYMSKPIDTRRFKTMLQDYERKLSEAEPCPKKK